MGQKWKIYQEALENNEFLKTWKKSFENALNFIVYARHGNTTTTINCLTLNCNRGELTIKNFGRKSIRNWVARFSTFVPFTV